MVEVVFSVLVVAADVAEVVEGLAAMRPQGATVEVQPVLPWDGLRSMTLAIVQTLHSRSNHGPY